MSAFELLHNLAIEIRVLWPWLLFAAVCVVWYARAQVVSNAHGRAAAMDAHPAGGRFVRPDVDDDGRWSA